MSTWRRLGLASGSALLLFGVQGLQNNAWAISSCGLMPKTACSTGWYCDVGGWTCDGDIGTTPAPTPSPTPAPSPTPPGPQAYTINPAAMVANNAAVTGKEIGLNGSGTALSIYTVSSSVASYQIQYTNPASSQQRPGIIDFLQSSEWPKVIKLIVYCQTPVNNDAGSNRKTFVIASDNLTLGGPTNNCIITQVQTGL